MTTTEVPNKPAARRRTTRTVRGNAKRRSAKPKAGPAKFSATLAVEITATDHVIGQKLLSEWKKFIAKFSAMTVTDAKGRKASINPRSFRVQIGRGPKAKRIARKGNSRARAGR